MSNDNEFKNFLTKQKRRRTKRGAGQRGPQGKAKAGKKPKFESGNLPMFDQKLAVVENDKRHLLLKNAAGMSVSGKGDIFVEELTNSSYDRKYKIFTALKKGGDYGLRNWSSYWRLHGFAQHVLKADKNNRIFEVTGKKVTNKKTGGVGWVKVLDGSGQQRQFLYVEVIQTLQVPVQVFSVTHLVNNEQKPHSVIKKERVNQAIGYANVILRQAGIEITLKSWGLAGVKETYPDLLIMNDKTDYLDNKWVKGIRATKPGLLGIKVFIVNDLLNNLNTAAFAIPSTGDIFIGISRYPLEKFGRVFAHKLCHAFGFGAHPHLDLGLLMDPGKGIGVRMGGIKKIRKGLMKKNYNK